MSSLVVRKDLTSTTLVLQADKISLALSSYLNFRDSVTVQSVCKAWSKGFSHLRQNALAIQMSSIVSISFESLNQHCRDRINVDELQIIWPASLKKFLELLKIDDSTKNKYLMYKNFVRQLLLQLEASFRLKPGDLTYFMCTSMHQELLGITIKMGCMNMISARKPLDFSRKKCSMAGYTVLCDSLEMIFSIEHEKIRKKVNEWLQKRNEINLFGMRLEGRRLTKAQKSAIIKASSRT